MSRNAYFMLLLLVACGVSSCKDEYTLDDEKPTWLHSSIYETLKDGGNYSYYLRLLADPDVNPINARPLTEVLSRTGSKTVFVANDDAWNTFFAENALRPITDPWHTATSYENLSVSQKKLLIHTSMLNNAIVMENLASSEGNNVVRGEYMRRYTDIEATDSITHVDGNSLPISYHPVHDKDNPEPDAWWRFRKENGGEGIYLVADSGSMMVHFTSEHMSKNNITDEDFAIIMGHERSTEDVHIYDALLTSQDGVAENGYVNTTEKVIYPLPNMAELLKTNGKTNIFSHMLDRWSVPYFNKTVTEAYKDVMASRGITWTDSIFTKRYISKITRGLPKNGLDLDPNGNKFSVLFNRDVQLKFDPAWNEYYFQQANSQYDMAAMYVPNDEAMWEYFTEGGGGWNLIQTHYLKKGTANEITYVAPVTQEDLFKQIDQIPISILKSLVNTLMMNTFVGSVPSKMTKQIDDANEQLFYPEDKDHIQNCLLANNGVVYVMDKVYGPADYTSVAAPAYTTNTNRVMNFAIYNGYDSGSKDYMGLNYYAYLKAMKSRFALFLPSDAAMWYYYDPVSFKSQKKRLIQFKYAGGSFPISATLYTYDPATGEIGKELNLDQIKTNTDDGQKDVTNRLKDIIESHTIVLKDGRDEINSDIDEYYLAKNGSPIKVTREGGHIVKVQGAFQVENENNGIEGSISADNKNVYTEIRGLQYNHVTEEQKGANGVTYILDSPIVPASRSVYNVFTNDEQYDSGFQSFYELTEIDDESKEAIIGCGLVDNNLSTTKKNNELKKYEIFIDGSTASQKEPKTLDYVVQFFNNFNYTAFIPTNTAVENAISKGLPTWDGIKADWEDMKITMNELDSLRSAMNDAAYVEKAEDVQRVAELLPIAQADSAKLQAKITYLINFVRYHFADNSVFADQSAFESTEFVTASYDSQKGLFCKIHVKRPGNGVIEVRDNNQDTNGNLTSPWITAAGELNVMARDVVCSKSPRGSSMNNVRIEGSSFVVIHQIPEVLNHVPLDANGRYDAVWATPSAAKKYVKRYAIRAK